MDWWISSFAASPGHVTYESISTIPINDTEAAISRRDGDPALVARVLLSGVKSFSNQTVKQDITINSFADGTTVLHLPVMESTANDLSKRVPSGSGFKISYVRSIQPGSPSLLANANKLPRQREPSLCLNTLINKKFLPISHHPGLRPQKAIL